MKAKEVLKAKAKQLDTSRPFWGNQKVTAAQAIEAMELYAASQSEPSTVTEGHPIALITPYKRKFDQWVRDFGINGQEYRWVNSIDHIRGRYFSAIQPGLSAWEVDSDIVDAARDRVRPIAFQQTQAVGDDYIIDALNRGLRKWGIKEKLSFDDGFDLLTTLQDELLNQKQTQAVGVSEDELEHIYDLFCDWYHDDGSYDKYFKDKLKTEIELLNQKK